MYILVTSIELRQFVSEHATLEHVTATISQMVTQQQATLDMFHCYRVDQEIPFTYTPVVEPIAPVPLVNPDLGGDLSPPPEPVLTPSATTPEGEV